MSNSRTFKVLWDFPDAATEQAWRDFLPRAHLPLHYCGPDYFKERFEGLGRPFAVLAFDGECTIRGAVTGLQKHREIQSGLNVRPQCVWEPGDAASETMLEGLLSIAHNAVLIRFSTWDRYPAAVARGFSEKAEPGITLLDLSPGLDAIFAKFSDRASIRYAAKLGVEVREATEEDIPAFHAMLVDWSRTKGLPFLPLATVLAYFHTNRRLFVAFHQGAMIAGSMIRFLPDGVVEYTANCSWPQYRHLRPNDLLQWTAIQWACRNGFRYYSMGGWDHFHRKFGGKVVPSYTYQLDRSLLKWRERKQILLTQARIAYRKVRQVSGVRRRQHA